jgi:competence CoiA-like predicted nuclease
MLVGLSGTQRINAADATRGNRYCCPLADCGGELVLKQGRKMIAHFAHKPPFHCNWTNGETSAHRQAKVTFHDAAIKRGLKAELEWHIRFSEGTERRADVMIWSPAGKPLAVEFQHTNITIEEIEKRAFSYASNGIAQLWVPVTKADFWNNAKEVGPDRWKIEKYAPRDFEKWISGFHMGNEYWMFDAASGKMLIACLQDHHLYKEGYNAFRDGEDVFTDGGYYKSKRYRNLIVQGPFDIAEFRIQFTSRKFFARGAYRWPGGSMAQLIKGK